MYGKRKTFFLLVIPLAIILLFLAMLAFSHYKSLPEANAINSTSSETDAPDGWKQMRLDDEFSAILEDGDVIWAGGRDGLFKFDKENVEFISKLELTPNLTYVSGLVLDDENRLFIASQNGVVIVENGESQLITTKDGLPDNRINCILKDDQGAIWIGTWSGAAVYRDGSWETINTGDGLYHDMVNVMLQDSTGGMWFGSYAVKDGGVSCLKDGSWYYFNLSNGLPNENVTAFYEDAAAFNEDANSAIWCGTGFLYKGGACRFVYKDGKPVIEDLILKSDWLAGEKVRSIFGDSIGNVWVCSEYDGAALFKKGKSTILNVKDGLSDPEIKAGITDSEGNLWLAARLGITYISRKALEKYSIF